MVGDRCVRTLHRLRSGKFLAPKIEDGRRQRICVDFSSPNIAKHFHIGNLRSTLLGRYVTTINRFIGHEVTSVNYLGDWGTQFAMICAFWPQVRPSDAYWDSLNDVEKIRLLTDCYVVANKNMKVDEDFRQRVHRIFVEMEDAMHRGDLSSEHIQLWQRIKQISKRHLSEFYKMFEIDFNHWFSESFQVKNVHGIVQDLLDRNLVETSRDGRITMPLVGEEYAILRKSNATSLYLTREISAILERDEIFAADRYLYVVDRAQRAHFRALRIILERMGRVDLAQKIEHVQYGRVRGLSTRNGRTEAVMEIIEKGQELAKSAIRSSKTFRLDGEEEEYEVSKNLSISTIIFNELKRARNAEYEFSFQNAFSLHQNNALSLHLKHTRLKSIETRNSHLLPLLEQCQRFPIIDCSDDVTKLFALLDDVEKAIELSAEKLEPCQLTVQLIEIAQCVGSCMTQLKVQGQPDEIAAPRLLLFSATRQVLAEGMRLLGIRPIDKM